MRLHLRLHTVIDVIHSIATEVICPWDAVNKDQISKSPLLAGRWWSRQQLTEIDAVPALQLVQRGAA